MLLCICAYGLQRYGRLYNSCLLCFRFSSVRNLKVGFSPNDDSFVQIFFVLFCVVFKQFCFLNIFSAKQRVHVRSFVYFLCVEIPIPKIVLSHTHKLVTSNVTL